MSELEKQQNVEKPVNNDSSHPLKDCFLNAEGLLGAAIVAPGTFGVSNLVLIAGYADENIRNISLGGIAWTAAGTGLIFGLPKAADFLKSKIGQLYLWANKDVHPHR